MLTCTLCGISMPRICSPEGIPMGEEGVDIRIISEYLGHRSLDSTLIYTHLTPLMRQGVADTINSLMGGLTQGMTLPQ